MNKHDTQTISRHQKNRWFQSWRALALPIALCLAPVASAVLEDLDRVVAVVDDDVVMKSELNNQLNQVRGNFKDESALPPEEVLEEQVLEHLIVQRLQMSLAERMGLEISDAEVDQTIERMSAGNKLTREQFLAKVAQDGVSINQLRQQLRNEITIQKVQQSRVYYRIQVSEQEVDNFLSSEEGKFWLSPEYNLGHILLPFQGNGRDDDLDNTQKRAQAVYDELQAGDDFRSVAVAKSGGQNALQGGNLGWRKGVELPELFSEQLEEIKIGAISEPFKSGAGFHILKVYDRRGAEETVIKQTKVRHILLKPSEILTDEQAYERLIELRDSVVAEEADFSELAKEHSEDIGSMLSGGDLGWSLPGKFVPEFEKMMTVTEEGEISLPFRSQFGWHILKVDERRDENMTETVRRNQAVNLLRSRRFNEELEIWLHELRTQAYVETRLNK